GVDGDAHSIEVAGAAVQNAGLTDRVELVVSALEDMRIDEPVDVVINNISMHECRDIDRVAERVIAALTPGGWFVVSDFPFPDTTRDCARYLDGSCAASSSSRPRSTISYYPGSRTPTCSPGTA